MSTPASQRLCLSAHEAAEFLSVSKATIYRMTVAGEIKSVLLRHTTIRRYPVAELQRLLDARLKITSKKHDNHCN